MTMARNPVIATGLALAAITLLFAQGPPPPGGGRAGRGGGGGGGGFAQRPPSDPAMADRGRAIYGVNCSFCHGSDARGGEGGPNLLRSQLVLDDKNGELIATVAQKGRADSGMPAFPNLSATQVRDIAAYIHNFPVNNRDPSRFPPPSILVGNAKAGEAYFKAKCATCHSTTGDLKGIAARITEPKTMQNTFVMPSGGRGRLAQVTATVTMPDGRKAEGRVTRIDDFIVSLVEADGAARTFRRDGDNPRVELHDPLQPHRDLLRVYTDKDIHDVTAWLVTLK